MDIAKLSATPRTEGGKGPSRRIRREGLIPAVAYGNKKEAVQIAVSPKALKAVLMGAHGVNSVVELAVAGGETFNAMVRQSSHHPLSRELMHADFYRVELDKTVDVSVPFRTTGKPKGVVLGGILQQIYRELPVRCRPAEIPVFIETDVTELELNGTIKVNELKLPAGVSVRLPAEQTVATVAAPERVTEEETAKAAAPAAAAAAGKAAPAAKAAAPAKDDKKKK
jgi:large subunit ribosomal protein L25